MASSHAPTTVYHVHVTFSSVFVRLEFLLDPKTILEKCNGNTKSNIENHGNPDFATHVCDSVSSGHDFRKGITIDPSSQAVRICIVAVRDDAE